MNVINLPSMISLFMSKNQEVVKNRSMVKCGSAILNYVKIGAPLPRCSLEEGHYMVIEIGCDIRD